MTTRTGPLEGIRVLDLTHVMSGPYATAMMADLGAEVLKVEPPSRGDLSREFGPHIGDESAYFLMLNRGKHSLTIDMKRDQGRDLVLSLAARADVVVENFRPGVADRLGIGYEQVRTVNDAVVYASITGFGEVGPLANAPAFDLVVQAMSGLMSVTGSPDGPATAVGESYADVLTGMFCFSAIAAALVSRERTGSGAHLDIAMLDSVVATLITPLSRQLYTDRSPRRVGNRHPETYPVDSFRTRDGEIVLVVPSDAMMPALAQTIGVPIDLDERFTTNALRNEHEADLREIIANWALGLPSDRVLDDLAANGIPSGPIRDLGEVVSDDQATLRSLVVEAIHPILGRVPVVEQPVKFLPTGGGPIEHDALRVPTLGGDTDAVLTKVLGLADHEIEGLRSAGVVGSELQTTPPAGAED